VSKRKNTPSLQKNFFFRLARNLRISTAPFSPLFAPVTSLLLVLDLEPYWQAEKEARKAKRGMWALGDKYISPKEWRKMQRAK
jgi:hypothetical protein